MELLRLAEAARLAGVSYPTLKQWIYKGKLRSVKTAGGHHRIPRSEIDRLVGSSKTGMSPVDKPSGFDAISERNKLFGTVVEVHLEGLLAQVSIDIGGEIITSIITSDACKALGLKDGMPVYALMKATEVMVIRG